MILNDKQNPSDSSDDQETGMHGLLAGRSLFGGFLMGLANLVPGISGGTMLLAAGIYPAFIESLSSVTRLKFNLRSLLTLGCVALSAGLAILLLAGTLKSLVVNYRWIMYSLFIGLTLGGVPVVWRLAKQRNAKLFIPAVVAFALMALMVHLKSIGIESSGGSNFLMLLIAGLAGASAMILPGLSGAYLLLLLGQYVPILDAVNALKDALKDRDLSAAMEPGLQVLLPVGIGVLIGVVVVGNLLKWLLNRYRTQTLGFLLGLLLGSVVGLYPFQEGYRPEIGDRVKGRPLTAETLAELEEDDWPTRVFTPNFVQPWIALALIGVGFAVTSGVSMIGSKTESDDPEI
ncbi:MAG: DUF368 domain-containing protein [Planctomycetota bacterium]